LDNDVRKGKKEQQQRRQRRKIKVVRIAHKFEKDEEVIETKLNLPQNNLTAFT